MATIERNGENGMAIIDFASKAPTIVGVIAATVVWIATTWLDCEKIIFDVGTHNILYRVQPRKAESLALHSFI